MEKLTSLPEKWCIEVTNESRPYIKKYREYINYKPYDIGNYNYQTQTCGNHELRGKELTLEEFKKYILKEETVEEVKIIEPLPQFKVIETIETITKVESNEGNQFFIGDTITPIEGFNKGNKFVISAFRYNNARTNICAITNTHSLNGIGIDKIEHYIGPKVEVKEETLLEKAKRLYPIGTRYVPVPYSSSNQYVVNYQPEFMNGKNIHVGLGLGYIYHEKSNEWAEIIK